MKNLRMSMYVLCMLCLFLSSVLASGMAAMITLENAVKVYPLVEKAVTYYRDFWQPDFDAEARKKMLELRISRIEKLGARVVIGEKGDDEAAALASINSKLSVRLVALQFFSVLMENVATVSLPHLVDFGISAVSINCDIDAPLHFSRDESVQAQGLRLLTCMVGKSDDANLKNLAFKLADKECFGKNGMFLVARNPGTQQPALELLAVLAEKGHDPVYEKARQIAKIVGDMPLDVQIRKRTQALSRLLVAFVEQTGIENNVDVVVAMARAENDRIRLDENVCMRDQVLLPVNEYNPTVRLARLLTEWLETDVVRNPEQLGIIKGVIHQLAIKYGGYAHYWYRKTATNLFILLVKKRFEISYPDARQFVSDAELDIGCTYPPEYAQLSLLLDKEHQMADNFDLIGR